jgi:hypothetical protein
VHATHGIAHDRARAFDDQSFCYKPKLISHHAVMIVIQESGPEAIRQPEGFASNPRDWENYAVSGGDLAASPKSLVRIPRSQAACNAQFREAVSMLRLYMPIPSHPIARKSCWRFTRMPRRLSSSWCRPTTLRLVPNLPPFGPSKLLPSSPKDALAVRCMDRIFDNYVMEPMMRMVFDSIRTVEARDTIGVADSRSWLDKAYAWLNDQLAGQDLAGQDWAGQDWAAGKTFSLADCAAATALCYADWTHPIPSEHTRLRVPCAPVAKTGICPLRGGCKPASKSIPAGSAGPRLI